MALDIRRFQWKRLPMGTIVASDVFQKKLDSIYIGLLGVTGIADDMIIYGTTKDEHDREPASISTSHKRQRTLPEQRQNTVQED